MTTPRPQQTTAEELPPAVSCNAVAFADQKKCAEGFDTIADGTLNNTKTREYLVAATLDAWRCCQHPHALMRPVGGLSAQQSAWICPAVQVGASAGLQQAAEP